MCAGDSGIWDELTREILDLDDVRLGHMDRTGIELAILSLNSPGVQKILDADEAMAIAQKANARMRFSRRAYRGKRPLGDYIRDHFHITTSGNFSDPAFRCTLEVIDQDKVHFCADYPFEKMEDASDWFDATDVISDEQRRKIGRSNAIELFKLDLDR